MKERYDEVLELLKAQGIDPEEQECVEYNGHPGEWFVWQQEFDQTCTPEQNALLNEWKKLV